MFFFVLNNNFYMNPMSLINAAMYLPYLSIQFLFVPNNWLILYYLTRFLFLYGNTNGFLVNENSPSLCKVVKGLSIISLDFVLPEIVGAKFERVFNTTLDLERFVSRFQCSKSFFLTIIFTERLQNANPL